MSDPPAMLEAWVGWLFIVAMMVVMVAAPSVWLWLILAERKDKRETRDRHPAAGQRKVRGPEDEQGWTEWSGDLGRGQQ
jgi:hypothetical protein